MSGDHNRYLKWRESEAYAEPMTEDGVKWAQQRWRGFNMGYKQAMKDADRAYELLRRAEVEMRYAGWNKYESDNTARNGVYEQIVAFLKRARKG